MSSSATLESDPLLSSIPSEQEPLTIAVAREAFAQALSKITVAVAPKPNLPVLSHILIEAVPSALRLSATNLDLTIQVAIPAEVSRRGSFLLPAKKLSELAKVLPSAPIMMIVRPKEQRVELRSAQSKFRLYSLPCDDFPTLPRIDYTSTWQCEAARLQALVASTAFAASTEESRPILQGVLWQLRPTSMRMVATNGHRLAWIEEPQNDKSVNQEKELIVPPVALEQLARLFDGKETIEISAGENHLAFRSASCSLTTRLIQGPYPSYESVIPTTATTTATIEKYELVAALRRILTVTSDGTHRARFVFTSDNLTISVQTPDLGEGHDEVGAKLMGEPLTIGFNTAYLLDVLEHVPGSTVQLQATTPERAAVIQPTEWALGQQGSFVIMPMRLMD